MKIIVIGNGLAGTIFAKTLHELNQEYEIEIYSDEGFPYYPRPNLIEFLAGSISLERMFPYSEEWFKERGIGLYLNAHVTRIFPDTKEVEIMGGKRAGYDTLVLANGAYSFVPPFKGTEKKGVFTLRTLNDAFEILDYLQNHPKAAIIGGGLLGLEIARAIKARGAEVKVIEFFPYLLPRQLDLEAAALLKAQIEKMGIEVFLDIATEEILGSIEAQGLRFKGGRELEIDMAVIAAGVRPNIAIAQDAGLETDKGIIVNEFLQTSDPSIYAAGDSVQFQDTLWGIIPASFEQARIAAHNVFGSREKYTATVPSNSLKVLGLDVTSIGTFKPEEGSCEEFRKSDEAAGVYKKIVVKDGLVIGAIWMGTKKGVNEISRIVTQGIKVEKWKDSILEDDFDFSVIP
jgi:nitrite reductase (NADH) large subunit